MLAEFRFNYNSPIVCAAIHNGHEISKDVKDNLVISENIQLMEEDPYTEQFTKLSQNAIIAHTSRFEVDLNRPVEKCIYLKPEDTWGLKTSKNPPTNLVISNSIEKYNEFYNLTKRHLTEMKKRYGKFFVYDIHSYNHHRKGPKANFDDPKLNPEINIGTNNMPEKWSPLVEKIQNKFTSIDYFGRSLDVRKNVKFTGGNFSRWVHNNFPDSACCISVEFKKIWMDEWTCEIYKDKFEKLIHIFNSTFKLIEADITNY
jgi:N-formylglutamate amidohydrolase